MVRDTLETEESGSGNWIGLGNFLNVMGARHNEEMENIDLRSVHDNGSYYPILCSPFWRTSGIYVCYGSLSNRDSVCYTLHNWSGIIVSYAMDNHQKEKEEMKVA